MDSEYDFDSLEPKIHQVLSLPGVDLARITAKAVRKELLALEPSLTDSFLKQNKEAINAVITRVYAELYRPAEEAEDESDRGRTSEHDNHYGADAEEKQSSPKKKARRQMSDAELARQLSNELNSRPSRRSTRSANSTRKKGKGVRARKSATTVDSDDSEQGDTTKGEERGARGGFAKEFMLRFINYGSSMLSDIPSSPALAKVVEADKLSRPQVVKRLWIYIKQNECQNPENRQQILCDSSLKAVFGVGKVTMFKMNKKLGEYVSDLFPYCYSLSLTDTAFPQSFARNRVTGSLHLSICKVLALRDSPFIQINDISDLILHRSHIP